MGLSLDLAQMVITAQCRLVSIAFRMVLRNMQMITIVVMAYVFSVQQGISQGVKKIKMYRDQSKSLAISFFR